MRTMDDIGVGRLIMLARQRRNWRQSDLAAAAGVSRALVALAEAGALHRLTIRSVRKIAAPLEIRLPFSPLWNGGEADRLRDRDHAQLVEHVVGILTALGWRCLVEHTFNHYGERGSIDIIAWHEATRTLLVVEVKTRVYDVQRLMSGLDRKARLAPRLMREQRGWAADAIGRLVVLPELTASRRFVDQHAASFASVLPARAREIRTWLRQPAGSLAGIWFLSSANRIGGIQVKVGRQRVRTPRNGRSNRPDPRNANAFGV
jgi:Holliday junction resolvase-like predicted endonuclease/DNA-binding XRE family transcriptional regulator